MGVDGKEDVIFVKLCVHVVGNTCESVSRKMYDCNLYLAISSLHSFMRRELCTPL